MRSIRFAQVLLPFLVIGAASLVAFQLVRMRPEPPLREPEALLPRVEVVEARPQPLTLTVRAVGTVVPHTETALVAEVEGRVIETSPALVRGGFCQEGEVLLRIDPADHELALSEARHGLARAEMELAREEADAALAREEWSRAGEGDPDPLAVRLPQLAEARAALAAAGARVEKARRDLERTEVRAPYAGRVRAEMVGVGQFVSRGTELARVYATDYAEVRLPIPDEDLRLLPQLLHRIGDAELSGPEALLRSDFAGSEHAWRGRVVRTEGEIDPRNRTVVLVVRVDDPYGRSEVTDSPPLLVGMFVEAEVRGRREESVFVIPREALHEGGEVWIVGEGDRIRIQAVEILQSRRDTIVLSSGLGEGDRVVVSPLESVADGMPVAVETDR